MVNFIQTTCKLLFLHKNEFIVLLKYSFYIIEINIMAGEIPSFEELGIKREELSEADKARFFGNENKVDSVTKTDEIVESSADKLTTNVTENEIEEVLNQKEENGNKFLEVTREVVKEQLGDEKSQKSWMESLADNAKMIAIHARVGITKIAHSKEFLDILDFCKDNLPNSTAEFTVMFAMVALPIIMERLKNVG